MTKPFLSVIIPAYNEAGRLPLTLIDIDKRLSERDFSYEIIVVDNNSTDATAEIANRFAKLIKHLRVVKVETPGKGGTVKAGMLAAKGSYRLFTDADNSTSIDQFDKMIPFLKEGIGVVIGSRAVKGARLTPPQPFYKQLFGKAGNLFIQALVLPGIWDTQCGFKCFSEEAALKIFPLIKINKWGFDIEILALAKRLGFKIKEVPITWVNDPNSHVKLSDYFAVLLETVKIRFWLWRNEYRIESAEYL